MDKKKNIGIKTTIWNKPVGYTSPVKNHNSGRILAMNTRKNFVVTEK
jgi:hypothetical protein